MPPADAQPEVRVPLGRLAAAVCGAGVLGCVLGAAIALMGEPAAAVGAIKAVVPVLIGAAAGLAVFHLAPADKPLDVAMRQIAAFGVRAGVAIGIAVWLHFAIHPPVAWFFGALLIGLAGALVGELAVLLPILRGHPQPHTPPGNPQGVHG